MKHSSIKDKHQVTQLAPFQKTFQLLQDAIELCMPFPQNQSKSKANHSVRKT